MLDFRAPSRAGPPRLPFYSRLMEILFLLRVIHRPFFPPMIVVSRRRTIVLILLAANCLYTTLLFLRVPRNLTARPTAGPRRDNRRENG